MNDVFVEVYKHLEQYKGSNYKSLFDRLDREAIVGIILDGNIYWTERNMISDGLTDRQHELLAEVMKRKYGATWLYA